ncbi:MAG TPA: MBL fold metallo-hydrolase [Bacteroidaceae bacterium]|nr:MBL fold metallo-hydrolase [Bacteroidaceae bacterium]
MIQIKTFVVNSFMENTYLLWDESSGESILVDAGCYEPHEIRSVENFISENNLKLKKLVNTHCHIDHVLGVPFFKDKYNLDFVAHREESYLVKRAHFMGELFGIKVNEFPDLDTFIEPGAEISLGEYSLLAIHVPGHSRGSLAYYNSDAGFVLTGDALFRGSIGRTDLPGGNYDQLINSIKNNLFVLPPETEVFPGHGDSTTIAIEKDSNPFF